MISSMRCTTPLLACLEKSSSVLPWRKYTFTVSPVIVSAMTVPEASIKDIADIKHILPVNRILQITFFNRVPGIVFFKIKVMTA